MTEHPLDSTLFNDLAETRIIGRYRIRRRLGQGGSGIVFLGWDPYIKRHVALKVSRPPTSAARERFFQEAQSAGKLIHRNIVSIYDAGVHRDYCYITMALIEGHTLEAYCRPDNLLPIRRSVEIVFDICNALDYAHRKGIIHRDIKPSNIMFDNSGTTVITDFGIAQPTDATAEIGVFGTPSYMSPEQLRDEIIGTKSDIFSIGCILYELVTGRQAFGGNNNFAIMYKVTNTDPAPMRDFRPGIPPILADIAAKALAKDPENRYESCIEFAYDLRVALRGLDTGEEPDNLKDVLELAHNVPFFNNFTQEQIRDLGAASNIVKVSRDQVIVTEGEIDDTFYIILSGKAVIKKSGQDIAFVGIGECFGEMAYIAGQPRVASVVATTDCILMEISATLLDRSPTGVQLLFFKNFAMTLVHRLSKTSG